MKIKYTSKIRRGLALLAEVATLTEDHPPAATVISRWTKTQRAEFNAALDWIEQEIAPAPEPIAELSQQPPEAKAA